MLKNHAHFLTVKVNIHLICGNIHTLEKNLTGIGLFKQVQAAQKGAFAAAGGSDYGNDLSFVHMLVNSL